MSKRTLNKTQLSSWRKHPVTETLFLCLEEKLKEEMLDFVELTPRGAEHLNEILAEKRAKYRLFEDLYFLDNLSMLLEDKLEIIDDTIKGE